MSDYNNTIKVVVAGYKRNDDKYEPGLIDISSWVNYLLYMGVSTIVTNTNTDGQFACRLQDGDNTNGLRALQEGNNIRIMCGDSTFVAMNSEIKEDSVEYRIMKRDGGVLGIKVGRNPKGSLALAYRFNKDTVSRNILLDDSHTGIGDYLNEMYADLVGKGATNVDIAIYTLMVNDYRTIDKIAKYPQVTLDEYTKMTGELAAKIGEQSEKLDLQSDIRGLNAGQQEIKRSMQELTDMVKGLAQASLTTSQNGLTETTMMGGRDGYGAK